MNTGKGSCVAIGFGILTAIVVALFGVMFEWEPIQILTRSGITFLVFVVIGLGADAYKNG